MDLALTPGGGDTDRPWLASASWAVDIPVEIAGYRLHFTEARLEEFNGGTQLTLATAPYAPKSRTRWLSGLRIARVTAPEGRFVNLERAVSSAGPDHEKAVRHRVMLAFNVANPDTHAVQPGRYHVELGGIREVVAGPWALTWEMPAP